MLRLIGAGMVVLAGGCFGFIMAEGFRLRPQQLRHLQYALTILGSEIRFRQTPLPTGLAVVGAATPAPVGELFADLAAILSRADGRSMDWAWRQVKPGPGIALTEEDFALLGSLTQILGAGSVAEQERQLDLHLNYLRQLEGQAEQARAANVKIWRYLGVFSGLALALILL